VYPFRVGPLQLDELKRLERNKYLSLIIGSIIDEEKKLSNIGTRWRRKTSCREQIYRLNRGAP
jgi:hypothetical protein